MDGPNTSRSRTPTRRRAPVGSRRPARENARFTVDQRSFRSTTQRTPHKQMTHPLLCSSLHLLCHSPRRGPSSHLERGAVGSGPLYEESAAARVENFWEDPIDVRGMHAAGDRPELTSGFSWRRALRVEKTRRQGRVRPWNRDIMMPGTDAC
jgi:hypothetical protein